MNNNNNNNNNSFIWKQDSFEKNYTQNLHFLGLKKKHKRRVLISIHFDGTSIYEKLETGSP